MALTLPQRVVRSAGASTLSSVWRLAVSFVTHAILRRYIPPEEMGVWNWAEPLFILLSQVRDLGVPGHVVRMRERAWGNFLRLESRWGGVLALGLGLAAPVLALGFESRDEDTVRILRWLCLFLFIQGLGAVPLAFFEARQQIGRAVPAELLRNVVFAVLSIALAVNGFGVWSLVYAHVAAGAVFAAALWVPAARSLPLRFQPGLTRSLVLAGAPLALMSMLELAVQYLDALLLGTVLPAAAAARAALAAYALYFFSRLMADAVGRAIYPALVSYRDEPQKAFSLYRLVTLFLATFMVPNAFFLHLNALPAALLLGGREWVGAADYLRIAAFVPFLRPLTMFGREYLLTVHKDRLLVAYTVVNLVSLAGIGYWLVGTDLRELGMAVASYFPLGMLLVAWGLHRLGGRRFVRLLAELGALYVGGAVCFAPVFLIPPEPWWQRLVAGAGAGALFVVFALWRYRHEYRGFLRNWAADEE